MVKFEKRRQRDEESIDKILDDLELLRRRSNPDERISERNLAIASKFMDGVKSEELKTMLATYFTLSLNQVSTPDELRMKSLEYLLIKLRAQNRYSNYSNYSGTNTGANSSWYKPRDDMDKRRSCANCGSMKPSCFRVFCLKTEHEVIRLLSRRRRCDRRGPRRVR